MSRRKQHTRPSQGADRPRGSPESPSGRVEPLALARATPTSGGWIIAAAMIAVVMLYVAAALQFWHYVNDDAYITFRYSRQLAAGHGPYFNPGEHVEGYTNPLLMFAAAVVIRLFGASAAPPFAKGLGVVSGVVCLLAVFQICRLLAARSGDADRRGAVTGVLAAGLIAASPSFAINSTGGLETTLMAALVTTGVMLGIRSAQCRRWRGAGIALAGAALTRPEGALIAGVFLSGQAVAIRAGGYGAATAARNHAAESSQVVRRHPLVVDFALVAAAAAALLAFRLVAYDGQWLPNTYYAKAGGFWRVDAYPYIAGGLLAPLFGVIGAGFGLAGWAAARGMRRMGVGLIAAAIVGGCLPFVTGTDWMLGYRLLMPYLPPAAVVAAVGWTALLGLLARRPGWLAPTLLLAAVPILWACENEVRLGLMAHTRIRAEGYVAGHRALAQWLRDGAAGEGDTIALMDIGIVGFECIDQRILDITGLTDRVIAESPGPFLRKEYDPAYVLEAAPAFVVLVVSGPEQQGADPADAPFGFWTAAERRIWNHPLFQQRYRRPADDRPTGPTWIDQLAVRLGAERIFPHAHPGRHYLLAVFRRQDGAPGPDGR
jgi:hypothetical protein